MPQQEGAKVGRADTPQLQKNCLQIVCMGGGAEVGRGDTPLDSMASAVQEGGRSGASGHAARFYGFCSTGGGPKWGERTRHAKWTCDRTQMTRVTDTAADEMCQPPAAARGGSSGGSLSLFPESEAPIRNDSERLGTTRSDSERLGINWSESERIEWTRCEPK